MKPRYVQSVAVLLWGIQTDLLPFAIPMAVLLEARYFTNRRWALTKKDFYRVADLTSIGLAALIAWLFMNAREYHFITTLIRWLPIVLFPLVLALAYSTSARMPLDVMFYSLRRRKEPVEQSWDMDYLFMGVCLVATGTNTAWHVYYLPAAAAIICWALYPLRSGRYDRRIWILIVSAIFLSASLTQQGIEGARQVLKERSAQWVANFLMRHSDPLKTTTGLGNVGRMKSSDAILFRVKAVDGGRVPGLLPEASYDLPAGADWMAMNLSFRTLPHQDDFLWHIREPRRSDHSIDVFLEFTRDRALVPAPGGITAIEDLPAMDIKVSRYGSLQGIGLVPGPRYRTAFNPAANINGEPRSSDLYVPAEHANLMRKVTRNTRAANDREALGQVREFFSDFRYSLYQPAEAARTNPLEYFLLESRKGHCEYFATATTLLLRQLGVPARYVIGYAVQEYDPSIDMYVVRQRHAHAWSIAYVDGRWQVVDTTPAVWAEAEAARAGALRPLYDFLSNRLFLFQLWWNDQKPEDYKMELFIIGALLAIVLAWRIYTSEQVILKHDESDHPATSHALSGMESPFFRIQKSLEEAGYDRGRGEVVSAWLRRIGHVELLPLLHMHNRWRFDPRGIDDSEKRSLERRVEQWLANADEPASD